MSGGPVNATGADGTDGSGSGGAAVILAAGAGTRMRSATPKPLHRVGGLSLLGHVLATARAAGAETLCVVAGHGAEAVEAEARARAPDARIVRQADRRGTGHAVRQAEAALADATGDVLILYADVPLVRAETLTRLRAARAGGAAIAVLGFEAADPAGYGRLVRGADGGLDRIVEEKDADPATRALTLCNAGIMSVEAAALWPLLARLRADNAGGELYLTDIVAHARADGRAVAVETCAEAEVAGVNDRAQLARAEAAFQARRRDAAMRAGVTMTAPETVFLSHDTALGADVTVEPNVVFGPGVRVTGPAEIRAFSHLEGCVVAAGAVIGPYARLRPGAEVGADARVGNFVEIKNAALGPGAKASHLTYVGDATVGAGANLGAGTITCNYDGVGKHRTEIGAGAFVGSNTALVAPVRVGDRATVGAGSVITEDVPADALAVARGGQTTAPGGAVRLRERLAAAKAERG